MLKIASVLVSSIAFLSLTSPVFAQINVNPISCESVPFCDLGDLISNILSLLFFFAGLFAFIFILIGGIQWITAGGDKIAAQAARDRITAAVVGLIIVVAATAIMLILQNVLGINILGGYIFPPAPNIVGE